MNQVDCPYTKVSATEASKIAMNTDFSNYNNFSNFGFVATAHAEAQPKVFQQTVVEEASSFSAPFLIMILLFIIFAMLMSLVYVYHWVKFGMHDPRIHTFMSIYFIGLIVFSVPIIYNLIF